MRYLGVPPARGERRPRVARFRARELEGELRAAFAKLASSRPAATTPGNNSGRSCSSARPAAHPRHSGRSRLQVLVPRDRPAQRCSTTCARKANARSRNEDLAAGRGVVATPIRRSSTSSACIRQELDTAFEE
jgi:hypothetical protein